MSRLYLGLVIHNHQPVGNYGFVNDAAYSDAYLPMLEALERHPGVHIALHVSGPLLDWIELQHPDYCDRLRALCDRGQLEMLTGGYYEPILPMIADADKVGQIRKLSAFIEHRFSQNPSGMWLTERVWEPGLPRPLAGAGVQWTLVDDVHFRMAGNRDDLDGYYVTEDQGARVAVVPGSQLLRYAIPWRNVDDLMRDLRDYSDRSACDAPYLVLGDDGEKFGGWPSTHEHVWAQGWIEQFFSALEASADWLETITPGAYIDRFPARGLVYLPAASYREMMQWAMPAPVARDYARLSADLQRSGHDDVMVFLRGGVWRAFLAKYPEANAMHKRGVRIAALLERHDNVAAREALWAAQCNCPYWHGVFGGLYLRHIRRATLSNLIRAERLADAAADNTAPTIETQDFDFDGRDEILLKTRDISLLVHPATGGMISEFDLRQRDSALLDVLTRRYEPYHDDIAAAAMAHDSGDATAPAGVRVKDPALDRSLVYDAHRRAALQEWILDPQTSIEDFALGSGSASWAPDGAWSVIEATMQSNGLFVALAREHEGWRIEKALRIPADGEQLAVIYTITNTGVEHRRATFVSEWNLSPPQSGEGDDRTALLQIDGDPMDLSQSPRSRTGVRVFDLAGSAEFQLHCAAEQDVGLWTFPVTTVSYSEGGVERVYQGVSLSLVRGLDLAPDESTSVNFEWCIAPKT